MDGGLSTLRDEAKEQGRDWEEVLHQRAIEVRMFKDLGLPLPDWAGDIAASEAAKPEALPEPQ
jgi:capsid protein